MFLTKGNCRQVAKRDLFLVRGKNAHNVMVNLTFGI